MCECTVKRDSPNTANSLTTSTHTFNLSLLLIFNVFIFTIDITIYIKQKKSKKVIQLDHIEGASQTDEGVSSAMTLKISL